MKREDFEATKETIQYEPKRQNRFIVEFPREFGLAEWAVNTATKPKYSGIRWENMEVTFKDPIGPSTSQALYKLIKVIEELKKIIPSELPLFFYKIVSLDPTGVAVETWEIGVREVISIEFGDKLDYASDEMQAPKVIFRPMYCVLKPQ